MVHSSPVNNEKSLRLGSVSSPTPIHVSNKARLPPRHHSDHPIGPIPQSRIPIAVRRECHVTGVERVPSPMPRPRFLALMEEINSKYGMSRHGKTSGSAPAAPSTGTSHSSAQPSSAVPVPVAQQAQLYLEQNIKAWMQPKTHDQVAVPTVNNMATSTGPDLLNAQHHTGPHAPSYSASMVGLNNFTQVALQEHAMMQQQHPNSRHPVHMGSQLTSPSSGYSDIGAAYYSLSIAAAAASNNGPVQRAPFPHSLSFSGYSHHSFLQGTSYSTPIANTFTASQPSAAASFFARAAQRLNLSSKKKRRTHYPVAISDQDTTVLRTNFADIIRLSPPLAPPSLIRTIGRKEGAGIGKVKVMLRICPSPDPASAFLTVDGRKKQVTLCDPLACGQVTPADRRAGVSAPKMFAFDAVFSPDDSQTEVCSSSLTDVIQSVVNGTDGCLFVYGHSRLGKTYTMVGSSETPSKIGVIPCAISWLFKLINEQKHKTGARFSVRVSAVEVSGSLRDLLAEHATGTEGSGTSPGVYLREDPIFGAQLMNQSELRAPSAEKAAFLLDVALASRTPETDEESRNSHFLFTLHVYQYRVEKGGRGGVAGGRSRLHLFDLGSCEKPNKPRDVATGGCLSLSALGNVILALFNGQKHVPYKDNKLTQLLREALGSLTCRAAMIAHVSASPAHYAETLATIQLASRVHRLRRKKLKYSTAPGEASCDDKGVCRPFVRMHAVGEEVVRSGSSDPDYTSSSEQSCDTVIYVGTAGMPLSDRELTDNEGPPSNLPVIRECPGVGTGKNTSSSTSSLGNKLNSNSHSHHPHPNHSSSHDHTAGTLSKEDKRADGGGNKRALQTSNSSLPSSNSASTSTSSSVPLQNNPLLGSPRKSGSPRHQRNAKPADGTNNPSGKEGRHMATIGSVSADSPQLKSSRNNVSQNSITDLTKCAKLNSTHPQQSQKPSESTSAPQSPRKSSKHHSQRAHNKQEHASTNVLASVPNNGNNNNNQSAAPNAAASSKQGPSGREPKLKSDEQWIDGPRFSKPKFDSRTLHQLQKEQWVDGPGMFGMMDVHKENMIRKWVEDHSKHVNENYGDAQKEVWIDFPPANSSDDNHLLNGILEKYVQSSATEGGTKGDGSLRKKSTDRGTGSEFAKQERHIDPTSTSTSRTNVKTITVLGSAEEQGKSDDGSSVEMPHSMGSFPPSHGCANDKINLRGDPKRVPSNPDEISHQHERRLPSDEIDEISSNSADIDEMDNDEDILEDFDMEEPDAKENMDCVSRLHSSDPEVVSNASPKYILEYSRRNDSEDGELVETIEVMEPEEPVTMQDSCLQVTEEDIFAACYWPDDSSMSENPLPEVDQESSEDGSEHPLRVLSDEGLNLASNFSDSRAVSVDLDSISVPETWRDDKESVFPGLTWRLLHGHPSHRKKKTTPSVVKKKGDSEENIKRTNAKNGGGNKDYAAVESNELAEKLKCIARLRQLLKKTTDIRKQEGEWPSVRKAMYAPPVRSSSRLTMSEMMFGSRESSLEELREVDATSIHSEPAELDLDKYDFQFNVKPMNGLRLEAFYNRIHKVPMFSDQPQYAKPTQVVSPIIVQPPKRSLFSWRSGIKNSDPAAVIEREKTIFQSPETIRKKLIHSLRHPDGASDPQLNKHPSVTDLSKKTLEIDASHPPSSPKHHHHRYQRSPGNGSSTPEMDDRGGGGLSQRCTISPGVGMEEVQPLLSGPDVHSREIRNRAFSEGHVPVEEVQRVITTQPVIHQSSTISARLSRLLGVKGRSGDTIEATHTFKHTRRRNSPKISSSSNQSLNPSRSSPSKHCKTKQTDPSHYPSSKHHPHHPCLSSSSSWTPCSVLQQSPSLHHANAPYDVILHEDLTPSQRAALLCRSTSTPTSPFLDKDSGNPCNGSDSDISSFPSPYAKMAVTWLARHSSSGRGSDSSVTSNDLKETKELLGKAPKTQQFSGTSSGYESMPRDSEGTPLSSSSQESSSEVGCKREGRGRKGTRKKTPGSGKRSRSVPARGPITTSTTWQHISVPIERQPVTGRGRLGREWNDPTLWKSEEELCCTGLLCCKILDFY